ncbi:hypothetical protein HDU99_004694 [Rhizoclosmatium hyalinum]|nr:hypothetical protein HDU99_004694 [Rhizoclosmatium hyalinum]
MNLHEEIVTSLSSLLSLVQRGRSLRTTRATNANSESSRSHALFQIRIVSNDGYLIGVLSLVDLAGSERGVDSISFTAKPDKKTQSEAAEINKSLLSLKECIRALYKRGLDEENGHVPFRGSKLTHILRDSFLCRESRTVMVATISPGSTSVEHTLNTLRYADRVKELGKDGSSYSSVKPVVLATGGGKKSETQSTGTPKAESSSPRHETRSERPIDVYEAADDEQQSIAALQHDRNLVSSLGNYGQSDSEEESLDQALRQVSLAQRKVKVESHYDMNALRDQIKNSQSARTADPVHLNQAAIPNGIDRPHVFGNKEPEDVAVELPNMGNEIKRKEEQREDEENEVETEESSNEDSDFFYQDALSVSGATAGESEEEGEENDADEKEWRKYCTSSARQTDSDTEVSLRTRHLVQVQQQLMEIDQLLLERVRSGRMGAGAYITQLSELLGQRVDALRRASQ